MNKIIPLPPSGHIYLDADTLIYTVQKIEPYSEWLRPLWLKTREGDFRLLGSELLLLEILPKPTKAGETELVQAFRKLLQGPREFHLIPISTRVLEQATILRADFGLTPTQAIHVATAVLTECLLFITSDATLLPIPNLTVFLLQS